MRRDACALASTSSARAVAVGFAVAGLERFTAVAIATLPWLVVLDTLIPRLTLTFTSAGCALLLLLLVRPRYRPESLPWISTFLFLMILLVSTLR